MTSKKKEEEEEEEKKRLCFPWYMRFYMLGGMFRIHAGDFRERERAWELVSRLENHVQYMRVDSPGQRARGPEFCKCEMNLMCNVCAIQFMSTEWCSKAQRWVHLMYQNFSKSWQNTINCKKNFRNLVLFSNKLIHHNPRFPCLPVHALPVLNHDRTDHHTNPKEYWCIATVAWTNYYCMT